MGIFTNIKRGFDSYKHEYQEDRAATARGNADAEKLEKEAYQSKRAKELDEKYEHARNRGKYAAEKREKIKSTLMTGAKSLGDTFTKLGSESPFNAPRKPTPRQAPAQRQASPNLPLGFGMPAQWADEYSLRPRPKKARKSISQPQMGWGW